ncbi:MAG: hypothetical protein ACRDMV_03645 [Streptosporangiales bacterium]
MRVLVEQFLDLVRVGARYVSQRTAPRGIEGLGVDREAGVQRVVSTGGSGHGRLTPGSRPAQATLPRARPLVSPRARTAGFAVPGNDFPPLLSFPLPPRLPHPLTQLGTLRAFQLCSVVTSVPGTPVDGIESLVDVVAGFMVMSRA